MNREGKMKLYRHGDVLIKEIGELPHREAAKQTEVTLAEGEATGHSHQLTCLLPMDVIIDGAKKYLRLAESAQLKHQEHREIRIDPGCYEIILEREWDYIERQWKKVVD